MSQANVSHLPSTNATNKILAEREVDGDSLQPLVHSRMNEWLRILGWFR